MADHNTAITNKGYFMDRFETLAQAFEARFGTIENPVGLRDCDIQDHTYDENQEMYDGYDLVDKINVELCGSEDPIYAAFHQPDPDRTIESAIDEALTHPNSYNDEYVVSCVRARAAYKDIETASGMYQEAQATIAYAEVLQDLKKFW